jgi:hypothetical protein
MPTQIRKPMLQKTISPEQIELQRQTGRLRSVIHEYDKVPIIEIPLRFLYRVLHRVKYLLSVKASGRPKYGISGQYGEPQDQAITQPLPSLPTLVSNRYTGRLD